MPTPTGESSESLTGQRLGRFRVLERLGSGGMGVVYLAEDNDLRRRVALKVLPPDMAAAPERLERFRREALALAGLNHPNVVVIHSLEEAEGQHFLVMERVEGQPLSEVIPPDGLPLERFFRIAVALAEALSAAHQRGVTHRDLKPANVMITGEDRVKVLDFGLAKLREQVHAQEETMVVPAELTEAGQILGSYPFMAPEQAKGLPADHRSDLFSLGGVLFEMATGTRAFEGETTMDLVSSILRDRPPPVDDLRDDLPRELARIIAHCLEKDPDRRFQDARDLRNELVSLWDEWRAESLVSTGWRSAQAGVRRRRIGRRRLLAALSGVALVAIAVTGWLTWNRDDAPEASGTGAEVPRSLAVLPFENLADDPETDWLRAGLAEMLVTELSRSPELRIIGTDQLYASIKELEASSPGFTPEAVRRLADRTGITHVVRGSFVRAGETLQIHARIQAAGGSEILAASRVQGAGIDSIFSLIDELGVEIRRGVSPPGDAIAPTRQGIRTVTTSSVEALREYLEGQNLRHQRRLHEAIPRFERAVELDPGFAMAHAALSYVHDLLGHPEVAAEHNREAVEAAARLPLRERFYAQGRAYAERWSTAREAIDTLTRAVELYPDHHPAREELVLLYGDLELFERAIEQLEILVDRTGDRTAYHNLARMQSAQGRYEEGLKVLQALVRENPEEWWPRLSLGYYLANWGRYEEAESALDQAERRDGSRPFLGIARGTLYLLWGDLERAAAAGEVLRSSGDRYWVWLASLQATSRQLLTGDLDASLASFDEAIGAYDSEGPLSAAACNWKGDLLLQIDRPREALDEARLAQALAPGDWPEMEGILHEALARQALGEPVRADELAGRIEARIEDDPGFVTERLHRRLLGELALARGQAEHAVEELSRAQALLPPRGLLWSRKALPDHVPVWYALGQAQRAAGDLAGAEGSFRKIVESTTERMKFPVRFQRSHYHLAKLLEHRGARAESRALLEEFVSRWRHGDLDQDRVADAVARLETGPRENARGAPPPDAAQIALIGRPVQSVPTPTPSP